MMIAKSWLDRMIENNDELHFFDSEVEHMKAKYEFELGNLDEAFELWKNLLKQKLEYLHIGSGTSVRV